MNVSKFTELYAKEFKLSPPPLGDFVSKLDAEVLGPEDVSLRMKAYVLATVKHEVGDTWLPIIERGGIAYFSRYESGSLGAMLGNTTSGDGYIYRGRGYCQVTGRNNYKKFGKLLSIRLEENPDLALQPDIALRILVVGMKDGLFTGKKLSNYITKSTTDYVNARRIINGDVAKNGQKIADYALKIETIIKKC